MVGSISAIFNIREAVFFLNVRSVGGIIPPLFQVKEISFVATLKQLDLILSAQSTHKDE